MTERERSNIREAKAFSNRAGASARSSDEGFRWDGVDLLAYKEEGAAPFKAITRQVLFQRPELSCELRYFEMAPGGHSTFERHEHVHGVMIFRGRGLCLVGDEVREVAAPDLVFIPPMTWHQFRANAGEPFGFLCMVNAERDKPQLPTPGELAELKKNPAVAAFFAEAD
ncbi:cupin [Rhodomicrobium udaipurense JA643]|uniref:Cupin domain-containing protein n=1 Tax=Rhodomicrobium udaipurense TaxID=1202716 RepID=A0A8I1GCC5_9HYPH|nr:cupin domain-containing protein [Rhodomicrobium udaipurense]KAI93973.1 cupin [Rhodomicrobium udaipurense JA643]MBJ7544473.1 cupin domain-containing protein [Rhodomicrobium udaipurense]